MSLYTLVNVSMLIFNKYLLHVYYMLGTELIVLHTLSHLARPHDY